MDLKTCFVSSASLGGRFIQKYDLRKFSFSNYYFSPKMALKELASRVLRRTRPSLFHLPSKECNKFLRLVVSDVQIRSCANFATPKDDEAFDSVEVSKYLNFIASDNSQQHHRPEGFEQIVGLIQNKKDLEREMKSLENMSSEGDKEFQKLIETEKKEFCQSIQRINDDILQFILYHEEENDGRNVELKIVPGIGGEEAKLFSYELFEMYMNYVELKNWEFYGDYKTGGITICGESVYGHLKHEAGVHRVQRVPATENSSRIHTSTCSVVVLPQPMPHEVKISPNDILVETLNSSGPGGQNVNKRETRVRIKHIPTGITVENQTARYQYENLKVGIDKLRGILFNMEQEKIMSERKALRKQQAGTNDYSDKIRTYNFPQSRVTDHRINYTTKNLRGFLSGKTELDEFISQVRESSRRKELIYKIRNALDSAEYKNFEKQQT